MIDLGSVKNVCIIRPLHPFVATKRGVDKKVDKFLKELFIPRDASYISDDLSIHTVYAMETVINEDSNNPPFEEVSPLIRDMESKYNRDHNTLFVIDPSIKTTAALARLLEGPYRGFPWSGQTIVLPKDS